MDEQQLQKEAGGIYQLVCDALDKFGFKYRKTEEDLRVELTLRSSDLDISFSARVYPKIQLVRFRSELPFSVVEGNEVKIALAINLINMSAPSGAYFFDAKDRSITFLVSQSYRGSIIGVDAFYDNIDCCLHFADKFNEKLFFYDRGKFELDEFFPGN
ncbi:hypothetical protein AGMMS49983_21090 [Clostridia bacterium]|nr:hypothetical protein AGMMS49983_21090 [Clostridia bacterium]